MTYLNCVLPFDGTQFVYRVDTQRVSPQEE